MQQFLNSPAGILTAIGVLIAAVVTGAVAIVGLWDKKARERKKKVDTDLDHSEDRLVDILKKTVAELEKKVNQQTIDIASLTKKIDNLEHENETVIKVLQGRDEQTQEYFKQGFQAMKVISDIRAEQIVQSDFQRKSNDIQAKLLNVLDHAIIKSGPTPA